MGILDSFKKVMGRTDAEADQTSDATSDPATAAGETPQAPEGMTDDQGSYTVQSGDTLWHIAETVYGDGSQYSKIFDANSDQLEHPDRIMPGQKLHIPTLD